MVLGIESGCRKSQREGEGRGTDKQDSEVQVHINTCQQETPWYVSLLIAFNSDWWLTWRNVGSLPNPFISLMLAWYMSRRYFIRDGSLNPLQIALFACLFYLEATTLFVSGLAGSIVWVSFSKDNSSPYSRRPMQSLCLQESDIDIWEHQWSANSIAIYWFKARWQSTIVWSWAM